MRHQGRRWLALADARAGVHEGIALYTEGNIDEAQRTIVRHVRAHPTVWPEVLDEIGTGVLAMPLVYRELQAAETNVDRARLVLQEIAVSDVMAADPESGLSRGRTALNKGAIAEAKAHFDRYWSAHSETSRSELHAALSATFGPTPDPRQAAELAYVLLGAGLWNEAFALYGSHKDRDSKSATPLRFFEALEADLASDTETAIALYRDVVANRPTHRLALLRLESLTRED